MSAKDKIHDAVKNALIKAGWTITDDPLSLTFAEDATVFVDLGAERLIAAEQGSTKIAVEVKTFIGASAIRDMELALGQYIMYRGFLRELEPDRKLYVAINLQTYQSVFQRPSIRFLRTESQMSLLIVDVMSEETVEWIN